MIDLLLLLHDGLISSDEAYPLLEKAVDDYHRGIISTAWPEATGIDEYEASAKLQGATLEELVKLRYEGWPNTCCRCHQLIDYKSYGWMIRHIQGNLCLEHLECLGSTQDHL
jgi:hypothetical protein